MKILSALLFLTIVSQLDLAAAATQAQELAPHTKVWCAELLTHHAGKGKEADDTRFTMRDLSWRTQAALRDLRARPKTLFEKLKAKWSDLYNSNSEADFRAPHTYNVQIVVEDPARIPYSRHNEVQLERIEGRVAMLESDVTDLHENSISFGGEIRGRDDVKTYLDTIKSKAIKEDVAVTAKNDQTRPFFNRRKLYVNLWLRSFVNWYCVADTIDRMATLVAHGHFTPLLLLDGAMASLWTKGFINSFRETLAYENALLSPEARIDYENRYNRERAADQLKQFDAIEKLLNDPKASTNAFAYHGFVGVMEGAFVRELLAAGSGDLPPGQEAVRAALEKLNKTVQESKDEEQDATDKRYVFFDHIFYYDNGVPVLLNFVRIKRDVSYPTRKPKKTETEEEVEKDLVPGLVPAGIKR